MDMDVGLCCDGNIHCCCIEYFLWKTMDRIAPAGPIFLTGTAIILSLDAFFPYDTLGPLQYIVPYFVQV